MSDPSCDVAYQIFKNTSELSEVDQPETAGDAYSRMENLAAVFRDAADVLDDPEHQRELWERYLTDDDTDSDNG